jgi:MFS family permease
MPVVKDYWSAFTDPRVVLFCAQFFFWSVGIYGFVFWVPTIIHEASKSGISRTGLLTAVPYLVGIVAMVTVSHFSDRSLKRKVYVWPSLLLGALASLLVMAHGHFWIIYVGLIVSGACMYAPYGPYWAMVPEIVPRSVVGESMALINSAGAVGGFFGAYVVGWLNGIGGSPAAAAFTTACLVASAVLTMFINTKPRDPKFVDRGFPVVVPAE